MKKLLPILSLLFSISLMAQESKIYKQEAGDKNLEVQFTPFSNNSPISIGGIRYRSFSSEKSAFRFTAFVSYQNASSPVTTEGEQNEDDKTSGHDLTMSFKPGWETHLDKTGRLSPYFGYEFDLGFKNAWTKAEVGSVTTTRINPSGTDSYIRFGMNAVFGFDYYVVQKLYLGSEFGFGFSYQSFLKSKVKVSNADEDSDGIKNGNQFQLGPNVVGQIRLGYLF